MHHLFLNDIPFDLDSTLSCGQLFRWVLSDGAGGSDRSGSNGDDSNENVWLGIAYNRAIEVRQRGDLLEFSGCDEEFIREYFNLDLDLDSVLASVNRDPFVGAAIGERRGLRIVKQEPWECLLSYLCAQNAGIPFIGRMIENLSQMCGKKLDGPGGFKYYAFPTPEALFLSGQDAIRGCSTGYRAGYIYETAVEISDDPGWAERIRRMDYEDARNRLMEYKGVGPKVADCVLLFSFGKYEAFPVDVWIRRIMYRHYLSGDESKSLTKKEYDRIRLFGQEYFGKYAGYAQEYLFAGRE